MAINWKDFRKTRYPGVWKHVAGAGFAVRVRKKNPVTGETVDVARILENTTETQAVEYRLEIVKEIEAGTYGEEETEQEIPTLGDYAASWLKRKKMERLRPHTLEGYRVALQKHILPELGTLRLDEVTAKHIYGWKDSVSENLMRNGRPYARWTVSSWFSILRNIIREGSGEYSLPRNPCDGVRGIRKPKAPRAKRHLKTAQVGEFLRLVKIHCPQHYGITLVLMMYGVRWEEASALHADHIDEDGMELHVVQAQVRRKLFPTKNENRKTLPLNREVLDAIRHEQARLKVSKNPGLRDGKLFPDKNGEYRLPSSVHKGWKAVSEAMELEWVVTPHDLRRTCQNLLRQASVNMVVQQAMMGHSSDAMTEHYSHVNMDEKRGALDKVVSIMDFQNKKANNH